MQLSVHLQSSITRTLSYDDRRRLWHRDVADVFRDAQHQQHPAAHGGEEQRTTDSRLC